VKNHFRIDQAGIPGIERREHMTGQQYSVKEAKCRFNYALCRYIFNSEIYVKKQLYPNNKGKIFTDFPYY
jgi:hypothetical protein